MAAPDTSRAPSLRDRLAAVGSAIGAREAAHGAGLAEARRVAATLREVVVHGLEGFEEAVTRAGAGHLAVGVGEIRLDEKHVRAYEFELARGRHRAIVTVKSRGEVTLVGPFRTGKPEGPCKTFPWDAREELDAALGDFLERFLEEAATP
jgi:hypothetical protein